MQAKGAQPGNQEARRRQGLPDQDRVGHDGVAPLPVHPGKGAEVLHELPQAGGPDLLLQGPAVQPVGVDLGDRRKQVDDAHLGIEQTHPHPAEPLGGVHARLDARRLVKGHEQAQNQQPGHQVVVLVAIQEAGEVGVAVEHRHQDEAHPHRDACSHTEGQEGRHQVGGRVDRGAGRAEQGAQPVELGHVEAGRTIAPPVGRHQRKLVEAEEREHHHPQNRQPSRLHGPFEPEARPGRHCPGLQLPHRSSVAGMERVMVPSGILQRMSTVRWGSPPLARRSSHRQVANCRTTRVWPRLSQVRQASGNSALRFTGVGSNSRSVRVTVQVTMRVDENMRQAKRSSRGSSRR